MLEFCYVRLRRLDKGGGVWWLEEREVLKVVNRGSMKVKGRFR